MVCKRIIPCLDIRGGRVVKGVRFQQIRDAGDPVEAAARYDKAGADELVLLDIDASYEGRLAMLDVVERVASQVFIPFTVGGGITRVDEIREILLRGADKVSLNSSAVADPSLVAEAAGRFGSQCIVVAIDVKRVGDHWEVFVKGGKQPTGLEAIAWAHKVVELGCGEILLTSMDTDGVQQGFDLPVLKAIASSVPVPVIASGGAGTLRHFADALTEGEAGGQVSMLSRQYFAKDGIEARPFLGGGTYLLAGASLCGGRYKHVLLNPKIPCLRARDFSSGGDSERTALVSPRGVSAGKRPAPHPFPIPQDCLAAGKSADMLAGRLPAPRKRPVADQEASGRHALQPDLCTLWAGEKFHLAQRGDVPALHDQRSPVADGIDRLLMPGNKAQDALLLKRFRPIVHLKAEALYQMKARILAVCGVIVIRRDMIQGQLDQRAGAVADDKAPMAADRIQQP